ncbi:MAG: serine hydrolase [Candidatus Sumerlaeota bacterium]|nr:serine hydrolase [Candidatus Sumerlaeota bacterium]
MGIRVRAAALIFAFCLSRAGAPRAAPAAAPAFEWKTGASESAGFSSKKIEALRDSLEATKTHEFLVIRDDQIVLEWYAKDYGPERPHYTASMAKSVVGGLSFLVAVDDGRVNADDLACKYIPQWRDDPLKSKITLRQLATHTSGIEDAEEGDIKHEDLPGWKGAFWKQQPDPFTIARDQAPVIFTPGSKSAYSNTGMGMLSYAITASLRDAPQKDVRSLLRERVLRPIGVPDDEWTVGYGKTFEVDGLPLVANWGGASFTARATARIGRLLLREGDWEGTRVLKAETIKAAVAPPKSEEGARKKEDPSDLTSGLCWWLNCDGAWKSVPTDAFVGLGANHQILVVVPSLHLIVVRYGVSLGEPWTGVIMKTLMDPLMEAMPARKG